MICFRGRISLQTSEDVKKVGAVEAHMGGESSEHINVFLSKQVCNGAADMNFTPEAN